MAVLKLMTIIRVTKLMKMVTKLMKMMALLRLILMRVIDNRWHSVVDSSFVDV